MYCLLLNKNNIYDDVTLSYMSHASCVTTHDSLYQLGGL